MSGPGTMTWTGGRATNSATRTTPCTIPDASTEPRTRSPFLQRRRLRHDPERGDPRPALTRDQLDHEAVGHRAIRLEEDRTLARARRGEPGFELRGRDDAIADRDRAIRAHAHDEPLVHVEAVPGHLGELDP